MPDDVAASLDARVIEEIFQSSIDALRATREQVFQIAESGRRELERLHLLMEEVQEETERCIEAVDRLERASRLARQRLVVINADFSAYSDKEIRSVYAEAEQLLVQLGAAREREAALRRRRDELGRQLKHVEQTLGKAEHVVTQVGMALELLTGNWDIMSATVGNMREQAAMARQVILAQEEERRRVARDIHDGPAQLLANLAMRVEMMGRLIDDGDERLRSELQDVQAVVRDSLQDLRRIIHNLRPMALDDLGLVPAIRSYIEMLRDHVGLDVHFQLHGEKRRLAPEAETALFRVLQEALNNAVRHSGDRRIRVALEFAGEGVHLSVRDNGRGFDPDALAERGAGARFGLLNMRERMRLLGGHFRIVSGPGRGTHVSFFIPWSRAALPANPTEGGGMGHGD